MALSTEWQKDENDNKSSINTLFVGSAFAYYIEIADKLYLTPEIGFYFVHSTSKDKTGSVTVSHKGNGFDLQVLPVMLEFRPTTHFGFSASLLGLNYIHLKIKDTDVKANNTDFTLGLNPVIGFKYYF
jgi:hypothetical protein